MLNTLEFDVELVFREIVHSDTPIETQLLSTALLYELKLVVQ